LYFYLLILACICSSGNAELLNDRRASITPPCFSGQTIFIVG